MSRCLSTGSFYKVNTRSDHVRRGRKKVVETKDSGEQAGNVAHTKVHLSLGKQGEMKKEGKCCDA